MVQIPVKTEKNKLPVRLQEIRDTLVIKLFGAPDNVSADDLAKIFNTTTSTIYNIIKKNKNA